MNDFIEFFQGLETRPLQRFGFFIGGMLFLWILEGSIPLLSLKYRTTKWRHALVNLGFTAIHFIIHTIFAIFILMLSDWCKNQQFGLIYWFHSGIWGAVIITALCLDFCGGWLVHIVEHKVPFLWNIHLIHHSDNKVDVTTGLRHHPLESILRGIFFLLGVIISGAPMFAVMIFQTLLVFFTTLTHANIKLPSWIDETISLVLISPNMHKVHHHWKQPYTDSNYGAVFSIWDRLLGTFKKLDISSLKYGLDRYYPNEKDEDMISLFKAPFRKNKP